MYHWRGSVDGSGWVVDLAFTDREGGAGPALAAKLAPSATLVQVHQVHGRHVLDAAEVSTAQPRCDHCDLAQADGLITTSTDFLLEMRAADCLPVLLADVEAGVIGAAHAGRAGMVAGVAPATVAAMRERGAEQITAWLGPHICGACYEVPEALRAEVGVAVPASFSTTSWGSPALDIGAGVRAQLEEDGVSVVDHSACTRESQALESYRRDGAASGRQAGLIRLRRR